MTRLISGEIYLHGEITNAVLFDSNRIIAIGEKAMESGVCAEEVPFLTHAFADRHLHPVLAGREAAGPNVTAARTIQEVQEIVSRWLKEHPEASWAVGGAYNRSMAPEGRMEAAWLDQVAPDRPVVLHGADHHTIWVNSVALREAGLLDGVPELSVGSIDLDDRGQPLGVLREEEAKALIERVMPKVDRENDLAALLWAQGQLIELGVSVARDAWVTDEIFEVYQLAAQRGLLELRFDLAFWLQPGSWQEALPQIALKRSQIASERLSASSVKVFIDGVLGSATAALKEPYESNGENYGDLIWNDTELAQCLLECSLAGFDLHLHAIGDAAVAKVLDAVEAAGIRTQVTVAHAELLDDADLERAVRLGVRFNVQPSWAKRDSMFHSCVPHLGVQRAEQLYRFASMAKAGAQLEFGSDWPVSSANPLLGLEVATTRSVTGDGDSQLNPAEQLSLAEALATYSTDAATDFVVLSANPFRSSIADIRVLETIIGGQTKFTRQ